MILTDKELERILAMITVGPMVQDGSHCLIGPQREVSGRSRMRVRGKKRLIHRVLYEHFKGPIPEGAEAAHVVCWNGHLGCVAWYHIEPQRSVENNRDRCSGAGLEKEFCPKCGDDYSWSKRTGTRRGYQHVCKNCDRTYRATPEYRAKEASRKKANYAANPEKVRARVYAARAAAPEKVRAQARARYAANSEKFREVQRKIRATPEGRAKCNASTRASQRKIRATPEGRTKYNASKRASRARKRSLAAHTLAWIMTKEN